MVSKWMCPVPRGCRPRRSLREATAADEVTNTPHRPLYAATNCPASYFLAAALASAITAAFALSSATLCSSASARDLTCSAASSAAAAIEAARRVLSQPKSAAAASTMEREPVASARDRYDRLVELRQLLAAGLIDEADFHEQKGRILGEI